MMRSPVQLIQDLRDCLFLIERDIEDYHRGFRIAYKTLAGQLRILLCDIHRGNNNALLLKIFPSIKLHPIVGSVPDEHVTLRIPGAQYYNGTGKVRMMNIFDRRQKPLDLNDWLQQPLFNQQITIIEYLRSLADKDGGAHLDTTMNSTLALASSVFMGMENMKAVFIVAIAEYILSVLKPIVNEIP